MSARLLSSAIFAGVAAGIIAAILQFWLVIPSLLEGELYETGARVHFADGSAQSERGAPGLGGEFSRHAMTVFFNIVTYAAYGLILMAFMVLAERRGYAINFRTGLVWGLCGFIAVQLAPAIGLPPELPGTPAPEVGPRQVWWLLTVIFSAVGIAFLAFGRAWVPLAGVALLAMPHLIGAPHLDRFYGVAPPELSAHFVTLSLGAAVAGWAVLGGLAGWFWARSDE